MSENIRDDNTPPRGYKSGTKDYREAQYEEARQQAREAEKEWKKSVLDNMAALKRSIDKHGDDIHELTVLIKTHIAHLSGRLDTLTARVDNLERSVSGLTGTVVGLTSRVDTIEKSVAAMDAKVTTSTAMQSASQTKSDKVEKARSKELPKWGYLLIGGALMLGGRGLEILVNALVKIWTP